MSYLPKPQELKPLTPEEHKFLIDMIEHHQMGVMMSNDVLKTTNDNDIMFISLSIIYQQKNEIDTMKQMLKMRPKNNTENYSVEYSEKSLKEWFKEKWVDISRPKKNGGFEPCGRDDANSGKYPKCVPASRASKMSDEEIRSAVSRKRRAESTQTRDGNKPIYVSTDKKDAFDSEEKSAIPTDSALYARVKAEAKAKFDVYPSAYANAWLVREYKKRGGGYRSEKADDGEYGESFGDITEIQLSDFFDWIDEKSNEYLKDNKVGDF